MPPKKHSNSPATDHTGRERVYIKIQKIIILTTPNELQENIVREFSEIRKTIHDMNKKFSKGIIINNQTEIPLWKKLTNKV